MNGRGWAVCLFLAVVCMVSAPAGAAAEIGKEAFCKKYFALALKVNEKSFSKNIVKLISKNPVSAQECQAALQSRAAEGDEDAKKYETLSTVLNQLITAVAEENGKKQAAQSDESAEPPKEKKAKKVKEQPAKEQPVQQAEAPAEPASPKPGKTRSGNNVEPLSNGLLLNMERNEIRQKFGAPKASWVACQMDYGSFSADLCYGPRIARLFITSPGVTLSSGIGVGSSKADVARVFSNPYGLTTGQYILDFSYNGDKVSKIKIDPANGDFKPYAASESKSAKTSAPKAAGELAGMYWCVMPTWSKGTINLLADGTYQMNGQPGGHYKYSQGEFHFDGTLKSWNNGVATMDNGNMIFSWKNQDGAHQYFAYRK